MTINDLIKPGPPLEADGMITIYKIDTGKVVAQYEGLEVHRKMELLLATPNPDCEYCLGQGELYWHSSDCENDDCALAGGYDDCLGEMTQCGCSILEKLEDEQKASE